MVREKRIEIIERREDRWLERRRERLLERSGKT